MKKFLLTILFGILSLLSFSQPLFYDTTFSNGAQNMQAKVWLPPTYYTNPTDSFEIIIMFPGLGEWSNSSTTPAEVYGPMAYKLRGGWDGSVVLGNGTHYPIYVTVIRATSGWLGSPWRSNVIDAISGRYRAKKRAIHITGLSEGGWGAMMAATYQPSTSNYTRLSKITSFTNIQGVKAEDANGSAPTYPSRFADFALYGNGGYGGKSINFQQRLDGRDVFTIANTMNAARAGSAHAQETDFGSGGHTDFDKWYGNTSAPIDTFTIFGKQQNIYQAMLRMGDTTFSGGPPPSLIVNAGPDKDVILPYSFAVLPGSAEHVGFSITSYTWSKISGPSGDSVLLASTNDDTLKVHKLQRGVYVYRLTATDSDGGSAYDDVTVTVGDKPCNIAAPVTYYQGETQPGQIYLVGAAAEALPWKGGDTVYIMAGDYPGGIQINKISGDKCRPIIIKPAGVVTTPGTIRFQDGASYFVLDGLINGVRSMSSQTLGASMTSNFTLRGINVGPNPGGVGIYIKQDPYEDRLETYDGSYVMKNIVVDNIKIRNVEGEGMYIGNTAPDADPYHGYMVPIRLDSVTISNCDVDSTGWDGIQLSNARNGGKIFNNKVRNFGMTNVGAQQAGIISGGNTSSDIYNNDVARGTGNGIQAFGYGTMNIYNNIIDSAGTNNNEQSLYVFAASNGVEVNPKLQLNIYDNQFRNPKSKGAIDIRIPDTGEPLYTPIENLLQANIYNNKFCIPGATGSWQTTHIKVATPGWTGSNNVLDCGIVPPTPIVLPYFKGLFKF